MPTPSFHTSQIKRGETEMEEKASTAIAVISHERDLIINLDHGDPTMFEPFWKEVGNSATVVIPGWQKMSYFSDPRNLWWFIEPEFANDELRLHQIVGNAVTVDHHIIVGAGSTQLIYDALSALASTEARQPVNVIFAAPYYSMYSSIADFLKSGMLRWPGDAAAFNRDDNFIGLVCSPNNPDGEIRGAVRGNEAGKWVNDMAYYWPQYTPMRRPADDDIMLFTVPTTTGDHAGTQIGWALVKDVEVACKMEKFKEMNTIGISKDSQVQAAKILKVISDGFELPDLKGGSKFFHFGQFLLENRWQRLRQAVEASGRFSLSQFPRSIRISSYLRQAASIFFSGLSFQISKGVQFQGA